MIAVTRLLAELLRPWHDRGLPEDLRLPENPHWDWNKGLILRHASLSVKTGMPCGTINLIGFEHAEHILKAWRPRELLLMEDVSLAFYEVSSRISQNVVVAPAHINRLVEILHRYLEYRRLEPSRETLRHHVRKYADEQAEFRRVNGIKPEDSLDSPLPGYTGFEEQR